jgi:hypothetical protein
MCDDFSIVGYLEIPPKYGTYGTADYWKYKYFKECDFAFKVTLALSFGWFVSVVMLGVLIVRLWH